MGWHRGAKVRRMLRGLRGLALARQAPSRTASTLSSMASRASCARRRKAGQSSGSRLDHVSSRDRGGVSLLVMGSLAPTQHEAVPLFEDGLEATPDGLEGCVHGLAFVEAACRFENIEGRRPRCAGRSLLRDGRVGPGGRRVRRSSVSRRSRCRLVVTSAPRRSPVASGNANEQHGLDAATSLQIIEMEVCRFRVAGKVSGKGYDTLQNGVFGCVIDGAELVEMLEGCGPRKPTPRLASDERSEPKRWRKESGQSRAAE